VGRSKGHSSQGIRPSQIDKVDKENKMTLQNKPATRLVEFEGVKDRDARRGTPRQLATISHGTCDYDDADVVITYRMCFITVGTSPSFKAATLFDTGANASYANREVAA
jgi:hypothetical protein